MKEIRLSPRLAAVARHVKKGAAVADVGADHGFLSIHLVQQRIAISVSASDLRSGPLARAKMYAERYGVSDMISFHLADGLEYVNMWESPIDTVVIAGMGGENIISILEKARPFRDGTSFVLQPQSRIHLLSAWLCRNGFVAEDAELVKDDGKLYQIMSLKSGGKIRSQEPWADYICPLLRERRDPLLPEYIDSVLTKLDRVLSGIAASKDGSPDRAEDTAYMQAAAEGLRRLGKECAQWQP